jgi:hypothetical protein
VRRVIPPDWPGAIVFVLSLGVALSMIIAVTGSVWDERPLSSGATNLLSAVFGATIGAIATYLGAHGRHGRRAADENDRRGADAAAGHSRVP